MAAVNVCDKTEYTVKLEDFSVSAIAESGQCFRLIPDNGGTGDRWVLTAFSKVLKLRELGDGRFAFSCGKEEFDDLWREYFDLNRDYQIYRDVILPGDTFLKTAAEYGKGIRILRQDPWEVLISFIISQRKSVPAIRTAVGRLSESFGEKIAGDPGPGRSAYTFPGPGEIAGADDARLAGCGLGYRVDYVRNAAEMVASGGFDLKKAGELPTGELIEELMRLKGVGIKVASCVALFGYHRLEALPVDVWMKRVEDNVYHGAFPVEYSACAGVLQQYMFNYARLNKSARVSGPNEKPVLSGSAGA